MKVHVSRRGRLWLPLFGQDMASSDSVAAKVGLRLVVPGHAPVRLTAGLFYRGEDPYAIRMAFDTGLDGTVEWIFARDLLAEGLNHRAGDGDVRLWPGTSGSRGVLNVALSSPHGHAHFQAPLAAVTGFLHRTFQIVPSGHESEHTDIEAGLNALLH
jgi:hypothetical protein